MKKIRNVVKQQIKKSQKSQKHQYDKHVKESKIRTGDLVMLKVELTFKLDRSFRGPYRVHDVTPTCASIQPINSPNEETVFVSLQRLSRCHGVMLEGAKPWLGHGQSRKRRKIRRPGNRVTELDQPSSDETPVASDVRNQRTTRSGRAVRLPSRFQVNFVSFPDGSATCQGGSCKARDEGYRRESRETGSHVTLRDEHEAAE